MGLIRTIRCLSDLCLSQTVTRRLWHKNTNNWSVLDSQRSYQLFPVWKLSKRRPTTQVHHETSSGTAALFCFHVSFSLYCLFSHSDWKCHRMKYQKNVLPLTQPKPNWFVSIYGSQAFYSHQQTHNVNLCPVTWPVTQAQTNTETRTCNGTNVQSIHTFTVQAKASTWEFTCV